MAKGFVFTIDALLAALLAAAFLSAMAAILNKENPAELQTQPLNFGNDFLAVLNNDKTLEKYLALGEGEVRNDMSEQLKLLPQQYCANFTVYKYKTEGAGFALEKTFNSNTGCFSSNEKVRVKRAFVNFKKQRLGIAEIDMWVK